jgi:hypothetical protein
VGDEEGDGEWMTMLIDPAEEEGEEDGGHK